MKKEADTINNKYKTIEEDNDKEMELAWDDVSGAEPNPSAMGKPRAEEIEYVRKMHLCTKVLIDECYARTGRAPIIVRWVGLNKGDLTNPNDRSRLVARYINTRKGDELFAGAPQLEPLKNIWSINASGNMGEILMTNDVSLAFFHAKARRDGRLRANN